MSRALPAPGPVRRTSKISNLHALRLEFLAGDGVAQAGERRFDVTRGTLERFGMPDVVLFARDGDDVCLEVRAELAGPRRRAAAAEARWRAPASPS